MLDACLAFGPWVTSKLTFWPSFNVLKPGMLIAEKCANRSSPPPSGVMNPKPFASLNHLTVPVAICNVPKKIEKGLSPKHRVESLSPKNEPQIAVLAEPKPVQGAGPYPGVFHKSTTILVESTTMLPK